MLSKTKIKKRMKRKTNPELLETIHAAIKSPKWIGLAKILSGPKRAYASVNLKEIDALTTAGDTVVVLGKVLGSGELTKRVRICSLAISTSAKEKVKKTRSEHVSILEEIRKNPKAEGIKIIQ